MTYLYNKNVNVLNANSIVTTSNPFPVTSGDRPIEIAGASGYSAFGEIIAVPITPQLQLDGIYGVLPRDIETYTNGTGVSTAENSTMVVHSGTNLGDYGVLRSRRVLRYRPGQGAMARLTAAFSTPHANTIQRAGLFALEQAITIGYEGTQFAVQIQNGGKAEIRRLQITTAPTGTQTANVQLNGIYTNVPIFAGSASNTAATIAKASFPGWTVEQVGANVTFMAASVGPRSGSYSLTSSGTGTLAAGSITQAQAGVAHSANTILQQNFNVDRLDGTGPSGMILDPSKLNVYQINFRWLGAGEIRFALENSINGDVVFFHHYHYSNRYTVPHLNNPSFKVGYISAATGGPSSNVSVRGASMMAAIEGVVNVAGSTGAVGADATGTTFSSGTLHHILSVRSRLIFKDKVNLRATKLKRLSIAADSTKPVILYLFFDPVSFTGNHDWESSSDNSSVVYSSVAGDFVLANELPIASFVVPGGGSVDINLEDLNISLPPNSVASVAAISSTQIQNLAAALVWLEE
jgi:hypothetical protein